MPSKTIPKAITINTWWLDILKTSGPVALIAIGLVYYLTQSISFNLIAIKDLLQTHTAQTDVVATKLEAQTTETHNQWNIVSQQASQAHKDFQALIKIEQEQCLHNAKTDSEKEGCLALSGPADVEDPKEADK